MKKVLFIVAALLLVFALCSCKDEPTKVPDDTSEIVEETSDVVIEDDIFTEETEFNSDISAEVYITAPKVVAPSYGENVDKLNQIIAMYVDTVKNEYYHDVSIGQGAEGAAATSRMLTYDVYTAKDGFVSVMLKITSSIAGSVHPTVSYRCINYNLKEGAVTLADVVGDDKIETVKGLILSQMRKNVNKYYSTADNALDGIDFTNSFVENEDSIYIVIDEYAIAPRSEGAQLFEISKGDIG